MHAAPGHLLAELLAGQHAVEGARRLAAAQGDGEAAARRGRLLSRQGEQVGGAQRQRLGVGQDLDAHVCPSLEWSSVCTFRSPSVSAVFSPHIR